MQIRKFILSPFQTNGYLLSKNGQAIFIDPGDNPTEAISIIQHEGLTLTHILITHMHSDHFYGAATLAKATHAEILASADDAFMVETEIREAPQWGFSPLDEPFSFTSIQPGELEFLGEKCQILATPGHSPGSLTFHFTDKGIAFVGDLIFYRNIGRTDFEGGDLSTLLNSVNTQIFTMPDATILYPGHANATNVADEKAHNPHFRR
ncbi:MBL fold metallo-hydrolase [Pseudodesulfovibrio sp. JC047]|uniref:MBL fold metallo-hydrolase n=1 Tax=Pseudodesulfovibrio sp. JC047 TaxID=2683199 RepID=UPI0013D716B9|nr:MBL fold metallo-hydrolase [Pseudodesulfovibrio sp. JC047]NDV18387.1 MBL fold metallo-hydrolase [Pseudodesulfovibrio sp. JC047]